MTKPIPADVFARASAIRATLVDGLPDALDTLAAAGPTSHAFLRRRWYAAALAAYGGAGARTLLVTGDAAPVLALPLTPLGPRVLGLAQVPGCYWPFRSFPAIDASDAVMDAVLAALPGAGIRIGPVYDDDPAVLPLAERARARGWTVLPRRIADSYRLDMAAQQAAGTWPRNSTLRKNRFHEKHLAERGALDWTFATGADWPAAFDALAAVEAKSWIARETDGRDAKFMATGHGAFWRAAAADPVLADMMRAALLTVDRAPAAFSFDLDCGALKYAIANSYDEAFAKHSPGKLLYWRNLVDALGRGIVAVDWGAGDGGYKAVIGAEEGPVIRDWMLLRPGVPGWIGRMLGRFWR